MNITIRSGKAVVSVRRTKAGGFANDYEIGTFKWDDVDGILALLREEFPALRRTNPRRRRPAPSRRRNPEYRYGVRNRPPGFATVPRGYIRIEEGIVPREARTRHGVVVYDRPLTVEEIESYELHPYMPLSEVVDRIVSDMDYPEEWAEEVRDAGERMIRPIAGQVLERDLPIYTDVPLGEVYEHVAKELLRRFPAARSNPRRRRAASRRR